MKRIKILMFIITLALMGIIVLCSTSQPAAEAEEIIEAEELTEPISEPEEEQLGIKIEPIGVYRITHYCACEQCCGKSNGITASGTIATEGRTCAMEGLPIGTHVLVVETGEILTVEDRFGDPSKTDRMDIFIDNHDRALALGTYESELYIVEFGDV